MKTFCRTLIVSVAAVCIFAFNASAQGKIVTKKLRISDVTTKTTKVVLSGNELFDTSYKSEISRRWRISPYDFITQEEYLNQKKSSDFYFLVPVVNQKKKEDEPGIAMLILEKGGAESSTDPSKEALEVIGIPYGPAEEMSGRELVFLPAVIDIIQNYTIEAMTKDRIGYGGLNSYVTTIKKNWRKNIFIAESDVFSNKISKLNINIVSEDDADKVFVSEQERALVGYVVAPTTPEKGSFCYKMLISADTHELYFFGKHKITGKNGVGFLDSDLKNISSLKK